MNHFLDKDTQIEIKSRNLPHWHQDSKYQFITFRLADSIPAKAQAELESLRKTWKERHPSTQLTDMDKIEYRKLFNEKVELWLDNGYGNSVLNDRRLAKIVADALEFFDNKHYEMIAYVVMPNHVHVLVRPYEGFKLSGITKSWKNFTALKINRMLNRSGQLWHHESWDRMIRNAFHYDSVIAYIMKNIRNGGVLWKI